MSAMICLKTIEIVGQVTERVQILPNSFIMGFHRLKR